MKQIFVGIVLFLFSLSTFAQTVEIDELSVEPPTPGVMMFNVADFSDIEQAAHGEKAKNIYEIDAKFLMRMEKSIMFNKGQPVTCIVSVDKNIGTNRDNGTDGRCFDAVTLKKMIATEKKK